MDLNKNILQQSIQQLPQYNPSETLWSRIDAALDAETSETNPETLQNAILGMPKYNAPLATWDSIEAKLPKYSETTLQDALKQLPTYTAPAQLWENIATALDGNQNTLKIVKKSYLRYAAAAVSVGVVVAMSLWLLNKPDEASNVAQVENVTYSQEIAVLPSVVQKAEIVKQDEAVQKVNAFCEKQAVVCEKPDFQALKSELEELTAAQNELQEAIGEFNTDENLVAQLSRIEEEKDEILKKILTKI